MTGCATTTPCGGCAAAFLPWHTKARADSLLKGAAAAGGARFAPSPAQKSAAKVVVAVCRFGRQRMERQLQQRQLEQQRHEQYKPCPVCALRMGWSSACKS
jgi:hypothetical protein